MTTGQAGAGELEALAGLLGGKRVAVLTGAGCSTESGIPDYRGQATRTRTRTPIQGPEFRRSPGLRRRYWARAVIGWERFREATPNDAHLALARLERAGAVTGLVTQNVDRLHRAAGSVRVVELHGALAEVGCLECSVIEPRDEVQARMLSLNPGWLALAAEAAPDGDAELPAEHVERFVLAACLHCGGPLKPSVVFFGENVPRPLVDEAFAIVDEAEALLVVGTSLAVFSGYRFVLRAAQRHVPIAIVNVGPVRGEELAQLKLERRAGEALARLADALDVR
jgi:NAD+-dependent protein deacetylase sirtuin 4